MPWRGPDERNKYPTLGWQVASWIEANLVIPDGLHVGEPFRLTDEQLKFVLRYYRLHPDAVYDEDKPSRCFEYRGALLMRPQKAGKSPFSGTICLAEAFGPVRFDGWDADGEPVGRPQPTPWVQIVATSEEQTDNIWLAVYEMASRGSIANIRGVDIGIEDINLPTGGKIEPRSASGRARIGARITHAAFDESHLMLESNGGVLLATTMKRNLAGMGGRWMESSNAYDPSQRSVAQRTHESILDGTAKDVLLDYRPPPERPDLLDDADSIRALEFVYGDAYWVDLNRVLADARDPAVCPTTTDAMRYFFNRIEVGVADAVDASHWDSRARIDDPLVPKTSICLGFDGSRSSDCTSLIASRIADGRLFHLRTWTPAEYAEGRVPRDEVDRVVRDTFAAYDVRYFYGDPYRWQEYFDLWAALFPKRIVEFPTNVDRRMDDAITRFMELVKSPTFTHDGDLTLSSHAKAAALQRGRRRAPRPEEKPSVVQHYLKVVKKRETQHIDAFIAAILAEVARGQAIEEGALNTVEAVTPLVAWGGTEE